MRILHFSDPHVPPHFGSVPLRDWWNKRIFGWVNHLLRRRRRFREVEHKLARLGDFVEDNEIDAVLCTGDYTVLGTSDELHRARSLVQPIIDQVSVFVTIPGNHDLYVKDCVLERRFERAFGDTLKNDLPAVTVEGRWPMVRFLDDHVAVISINSSIPHRTPWRSSGVVSDLQLNALRGILHLPRIQDRQVFIMIHHAPLLAAGRPERLRHGLEQWSEFLDVCALSKGSAVLFGHVHHCYRHDLPGQSVSLFSAGSVTISRREGFWVFEVDSRDYHASRGCWDGDHYRFV
jgi:3',5'-cyclic AMP phosphodiesterase CpdA